MREALLLLLAALGDPFLGDRVEHAAVVPREVIADLRRLGLRIVTQPGFIADRGDDYLRDVPPEDQDDLYRYASLREVGIPVRLSSDAPYGPVDPWRVMRATVKRRTPSGATVGLGERVAPRAALDASLTAPLVLREGVPDLVLLHVPLAKALAGFDADHVRHVVIGGVLEV